MTIKIYDWQDKSSKIVIPDDKVISSIYVCVLSGDETGFIHFTDGSSLSFDASDCRITGYYDGDYIVKGDDIQKWIDFDFSKCHSTKSYYRQYTFESC